ncbi:peptidase S41 [Pedobacter frigiditerrae]|uniref:Peptidase S41 n=1 Tax=Pedobacter frigiditerrae TaxID=2530452 RepID=A0A4R0MSZ2_9SPHI|nr:S41 family peptidase [Pedobacter frigiditerrae]TCC90149.1 peptidase S41 [Pedobacter frigiditerrae]
MKRPFLTLVCIFTSLIVNAQGIPQKQKVANLETFTRLCGYVRYFHPSDEAANLNWDKFIYYGSKEVENAANQKELVEKLKGLFNPIAPAVQLIEENNAKPFDLKSISPPNKVGMKEITWQHYGLGSEGGFYKSARTNRGFKTKDPTRAEIGGASSSIKAEAYRGKKFRLKAWMRTDVKDGQGQFWVRVDREGKSYGFFNNMDDRPIKSKEWKAYEIAGTIDIDASYLYFGAFLVSEGKIWIDNFTLEIEENGIWNKIPLQNSSFEQADTQGWYTKSKGYNYATVKDDHVDGQQALLISDNSSYEIIKSIFDEKLAFGAYFTKPIGNGLKCMVPQVLLGDERQTYPSANANLLKELQQRMAKASPDLFDASDVYTRLTSINIAWNVFQHFFPYKEEIKLEWEKELPLALDAAYKSNTRQEFGQVLRVMTAKLKDGHVSVTFGQQNYYSIQADVACVENKLLISHADDTVPLKVGDIILSINGIPALDYFNNIKSEISGSDQWKNSNATRQFLQGYKDTAFTLKVSRDGKEQEFSFTRANLRKSPEQAKTRKLADGVYYVNIGNTEMKDITAMLPEFTTAKAIICDLRGYPRGNHDLISYLLTKKDKDEWMFVPKIISPDYQNVTYTGLGWEMTPKKPHISAKIIFITGGGAVSYAESYMGFIKHYKLATIVGQPTAGANGDVNAFVLPGNYSIRFTGLKVKLHDGGQMFSLGIQPDVFVNQTISGITAGKDEYLEKALALIK